MRLKYQLIRSITHVKIAVAINDWDRNRIRKSPYYDSNLKYGVTGFTVYNKMYLPTAFSGPEKEYESLINDVTFGDFAAERQIEINGKDAYNFVRYITPRNLEKCEIGFCKYIILTDMDGGIINDACLLRLEDNKFWISPGDGDVILWLQGIALTLEWMFQFMNRCVSVANKWTKVRKINSKAI